MTKVIFEDGRIIDYSTPIFFYSGFEDMEYYTRVEPGNKITEINPCITSDDDGNHWTGIYYHSWTLPNGCAHEIFNDYREITLAEFNRVIDRCAHIMEEQK